MLQQSNVRPQNASAYRSPLPAVFPPPPAPPPPSPLDDVDVVDGSPLQAAADKPTDTQKIAVPKIRETNDPFMTRLP
jgi:hypothetical protein